MRFGAGCPPCESSGATIFMQLTDFHAAHGHHYNYYVIILLYCLRVGLRVITRHTFAIIVPFITGN